MNEYKDLVIIKGEDKTEQVKEIKNNGNRCLVFFNNATKPYYYSEVDCIRKSLTSEISTINKEIKVNENTMYNVYKILQFEQYYKLFFINGTKLLASKDKITISENDYGTNYKLQDKFEYFRRISEVVSVKTDDGTALLEKEYKKINFVEKDTALYAYLNEINSKTDIFFSNNLIFPFGSNESQYNAVKNAIENRISVIEGPPGTGKTQTILNIIANIIKNGKTVAVVSNNNSATENVYEKLDKYGLGYICATLGRRENKEKFIANQTGQYPKFDSISYDTYKLKQEITNLNYDLMKVFKLQNEIAKAKEKIRDIFLEHKYYIQHEGQGIDVSINSKNSEAVLRLKYDLENLKKHGKNIDIWFKIKYIIFKKTGSFKLFKRSIDEIIKACDKLYFEIKENELKEIIYTKSDKVKALDGENALNKLKQKSLALLNNVLKLKFDNKNTRQIFTRENLYKKSDEVLHEYPIVFSTTYSIKNCLNSNVKFDYVIMDEASQVDLITGTLALSCAKNAVIVGDRKQLQNVVTTENKKIIEVVSENFNIPKSFEYIDNSFLSSVISTLKDVPYTLLKEHYRCHPKIIGFCNKKFYDNQLVIMTQDNHEKDVLKVYLTTEGNHARGKYNQREIDVIDKEVLPELNKKVQENEIGIVAPFRDQKEALNQTFNESEIQSDTIHKFQGREKDAIIITTVQNEITDFVDDPQMLNVAVTRAKKYLYIVTNNKIEQTDTNFRDLIKYIRYNNFEVKESKVKSIYDYLYTANREERLKFLKDKKMVSEYDSENITYNVINNVLKELQLTNLKLATHVKLMHMIKNMDEFTDEEKKFANNAWTHVDFVIYNNIDKIPVLCIEVDGYYNHVKIKQQNRDELKNSILAKCGLSLVRLNTVGSGEEEKIRNKLKEIHIVETSKK